MSPVPSSRIALDGIRWPFHFVIDLPAKPKTAAGPHYSVILKKVRSHQSQLLRHLSELMETPELMIFIVASLIELFLRMHFLQTYYLFVCRHITQN